MFKSIYNRIILNFEMFLLRFKRLFSTDANLNKDFITSLFLLNVKDKEISMSKSKHCGRYGHWLEKNMDLSPNCKNLPDILGFEMKLSSPRISFGDFSASEYLFSKSRENLTKINGKDISMTKLDFMKYFGNDIPKKRESWSGRCAPSYLDKWTHSGQILRISKNGDITISYQHSQDQRKDKNSIPDFLKSNEIIIALWKSEKMAKHIDSKFNKNGFFICKKSKDRFTEIKFGRPFGYLDFLNGLKNHEIIFDSGMHEGNSRMYSHFRSCNKKFWERFMI